MNEIKMLFCSIDRASNNLRLTCNIAKASSIFASSGRFERASNDFFNYTTLRPQTVDRICLHHSIYNGYWSTISGNIPFTRHSRMKGFYLTLYEEMLYKEYKHRHIVLRFSVLPLSALQKLIYKDTSATTYSALLQRR